MRSAPQLGDDVRMWIGPTHAHDALRRHPIERHEYQVRDDRPHRDLPSRTDFNAFNTKQGSMLDKDRLKLSFGLECRLCSPHDAEYPMRLTNGNNFSAAHT